MPLHFQLVDGGRGVLVTAEGAVDDAAYLGAIRENLALGAGLPGFRYCLADFSGAGRVEVGAVAIQQAAELDCSACRGQAAFLFVQVGDRDLIFGLVRVFQSYASELPCEMEAFRGRAEAEAWLRERARERFGEEGLEFR